LQIQLTGQVQPWFTSLQGGNSRSNEDLLMNAKKIRPIVKKLPLGTVFTCPHCKHSEIGRTGIRYDKTRADGRIRTHIATCAKVSA
jgi:hypothetical protein